jgi:hypothetical protein
LDLKKNMKSEKITEVKKNFYFFFDFGDFFQNNLFFRGDKTRGELSHFFVVMTHVKKHVNKIRRDPFQEINLTFIKPW